MPKTFDPANLTHFTGTEKYYRISRRHLLEYVIVHEMAHLIEPTHSDRFIAILEKHYPSWREARAELNELPLAASVWKE